MSTPPADDDGLVEVRVLGLPVALAGQVSEHFDELSREFLHLAHADDSVRRDVPGRLLALSDQLRQRFSGFTEGNRQILDEAAARGDSSVDLTYRLPADVADAARELGDLLDEADRYCQRGDYLLTLATPAPAVAYRVWYLAQFVDQIGGAEPVSFHDWQARRGASAAR